jgi:alpha-D-ribose 1-methylphosphonate 5-triphosphate synthase subunit PhnI
MGYIAVRGGEESILSAETLLQYSRLGGSSVPITLDQIQEQLGSAVDRVMGEGGLYAPQIAAAAFKQAAGDTFEAAFLLRAYRSSIPRVGTSEPIETERMRVIRRISAAFKDIPGGQILGATNDYTHRLIRFDLIEDEVETARTFREAFGTLVSTGKAIPETFPKIIQYLRKQELLPDVQSKNDPPSDITLETLTFPAPRSARLQSLSRAETGGVLALAYSSMRGYGQVHPVIGEMRIGDVPIFLRGSEEEDSCLVGFVRVTECEVITQMERSGSDDRPIFSIGYGLCFGHNEVKAISMAVLDRALMSESAKSPPEDQEFVLLHTDGIESSGFCLHYKLPHYVSFKADLEQIRRAREDGARGIDDA